MLHRLSQLGVAVRLGAVAVFTIAGEFRTSALQFTWNPDAGTPQQVVDGFQAAANLWSQVLFDDVTVNVNVGWQSLPTGVLGQTIGEFITADYASVSTALQATATSALDAGAYATLQGGNTYTRWVNHTSDNPNGANSPTPYTESLSPVWVVRANAKALGLLGASASPDATIRFNSNVPFDFDSSDGIPPGYYDFRTVAAHELGHMLGFITAVDQIAGAGGTLTGEQLPSSVFDLFRFSSDSAAQGLGVPDTTLDGRAKYFSADGGVSALAGLATGVSGYQAGHWQEFTFRGLMEPTVFTRTVRSISASDIAALDLIGYRSVPEPSSAALGLAGLVVFFANRRRRPQP
jgi:hypothetical protein